MCGRTALTSSPEELREVFGLDEAPELVPRHNIPPSQLVAVVRTPGKLELLRWGLIPPWAKDAQIGHSLALARVETVTSKPVFRDAMQRRRCLVVVSGFFEWERAGKKASTPFFIRRPDERPFALAGIWDRWVSKDGEVVESCAVVTEPARPPVEAVHDRMPVVLEREAWPLWLDQHVVEPKALLDPRSHDLVAFAVGSYVNDPRHDDAGCLKAAEPPMQGSLFG